MKPLRSKLRQFPHVDSMLIYAVRMAIEWEESIVDAHGGVDPRQDHKLTPENLSVVQQSRGMILDYADWLTAQGVEVSHYRKKLEGLTPVDPRTFFKNPK